MPTTRMPNPLTLGAARIPDLLLLALCLAVPVAAGCEDPAEPETHCTPVGDGQTCAGVSEQTLGTGTWYTESTGDVSCASLIHVKQGASGGTGSETAPFGDLPEAALAAGTSGPGTCIALAAGTYQGAELPAGVSLLGRGIAQTRVRGVPADPGPVLAASGNAVLIRGVRIAGDGPALWIEDASRLAVESVLVESAQGAGVWLTDSDRVSLVHVRVAGVTPATDAQDSVGVGVYSVRSQRVELRDSLVEGCAGSGLIHLGGDLLVASSVVRRNTGYGIAATCAEPPCDLPPAVTIQGSQVAENEGVGTWLSGVFAQVDALTLSTTRRDRFGFSRGFECVDVPDLQLRGSTIEGGENWGVLLHGTSGVIEGTRVANQQGRGLWIQNPEGMPAVPVDLDGVEVLGNREVGVGILGDCLVNVIGGEVTGTVLADQFTTSGTIHDVGDGIQALSGSSVTVEQVTFQGNQRQSILADDIAFLTVQNNQFADAADASIAVQNIGVANLDEADNLQCTGNQTATGMAVSPYKPDDPFGFDPNPASASHLPAGL